MFDRVRIREHTSTQEKNVVGLIGVCYGFTTPSGGQVPEEEIIGELTGDLAYNVSFGEFVEPMWFASHLVEFVDHNPGVKTKMGDVEYIRLESGEWEELPKTKELGMLRKFMGFWKK